MKTRFTGAVKALPIAILGMGLGVAVLLVGGKVVNTIPPAEADKNCAQVAAEFGDYALVSPGQEFQGLPATACYRVTSPAKFDRDGTVREPATDFFVFIYGDCVIPEGEEACTPPVQVIVDPPCADTPLAEHLKAEKVKVRGHDVDVKTDASVRIETKDWKATLYAADSGDYEKSKQRALQLAAALKGANAVAAELTVDKSFDTKIKESRVCK